MEGEVIFAVGLDLWNWREMSFWGLESCRQFGISCGVGQLDILGVIKVWLSFWSFCYYYYYYYVLWTPVLRHHQGRLFEEKAS